MLVRLGKRVKINIVIAILLCMAFAVNIGATLAVASYSFTASSINTSVGETTKHETYTEYANAQGSSGQYIYSVGSANGQLSVNYGFSHAHDLMVRFTATYTNESHSANDFSLNFVNRDKWCVDMNVVSGLAPAGETPQTYYALASASNSISGVMYYMDTLTGSGTLPIISGVNFYTSPNNSYTYIGDTLTVTLSVEYAKSSASNYTTTSHSFKDELLGASTTAFTNWIDYMAGTALATPRYMLYNAYANNSTALAYPSDYNWTASGFNITEQTEPLYSNTAYRYAIGKEGENKNGSITYHTTRSYSAVAAGNTYYGGVGVYVFPTSTLKTVGVTVDYHWQKNGTIAGTAQNNMVQAKYDNDYITEIKRIIEDDKNTENVDESGEYYAYYYKATITEPTYINVLEHIMLTAESGYRAILNAGYSLVITQIAITSETTNPSGWTSSSVADVQINNSTKQSPTLVRIKDVATGSKTFETNVSAHNNGTSTMAITSFKVAGKLWYANYTDQDHSAFARYDMGNLPDGSLTYDTNIWSATYSAGVYTFTRTNTSAHIPAGYGIKLISGVSIPMQYYPSVDDAGFIESTDSQGNKYFNTIAVNDFWCELEVTDVITTSTISYSGGSYTGVEVVAEGYYSTIESDSTASIYLKNNTNQDITSVSLSGLRLAALNSASSQLLPRDNLNTSTEFNYSLTNCLTGATQSTVKSTASTSQSTSNIIIRPNEKVLLYTITPKSKAVIYTYNISATVGPAAETRDLDLIFNINQNTSATTQTADILNNSDTYHEFRLASSIDLTDYLTNPTDFVEQQVDDVYYYYYKGVICAHQCMTIFKKHASAVTVDYIPHVDGSNADRYVASNYTTWNPPADWLTAMQAIYGEPDRANAIVVPAPQN